MRRFPIFAAVAVMLAVVWSAYAAAQGQTGFNIYLPLTVQGGAGSSQQPTTGPTTKPTAKPTTEPTASKPFFLPREIDGVSNTTDVSTALDPAGGVHVTYSTIPYTYAVYGYCAANCIDASKFSTVRFGGVAFEESIDDVTLALDTAGHPRMLWSTSAGWTYAACDANCTVAASWNATVIAPVGEATHSQRFVIDKQNRAHIIDHGDLYETYYITCATNCTDAANWTRTQISTAAFSKPSLAVTAAGQPHLIFQTYDFGDDSQTSNDNRLGYATCDSNCTVAANWSTGLRFDEVDPYDGSWSLVLDSQERPRVALAPWRPYGSDTDGNQLYLMWCNATCSSATNNWIKTRLTDSEESVSSVAMVLDRNDRPQMAFAYSNTEPEQRGIEHARCISNCYSDLGNWDSVLVDATEKLNTSEPVNNTSICTNPINPTWALGWTTRLVLDSNGKAQITYDARHLWTCYSGTQIRVQRDINWARYTLVQ